MIRKRVYVEYMSERNINTVEYVTRDKCTVEADKRIRRHAFQFCC